MHPFYFRLLLVFFICTFCSSTFHGAANPKPLRKEFQNQRNKDIVLNSSNNYFPEQKDYKSKKGFFKSLFKKKKKSNRLKFKDADKHAKSALITGSLALSLLIVAFLVNVGILAVVSLGLAIYGLVDGIKALKNKTQKKTSAIFGIILSGITIVSIIAAFFLLLILLFASLA